MKIGPKMAVLVGGLLTAQVASLAVSTGLMLQAQREYRQVLDQVVVETNLANAINRDYQNQTQAWDRLLLHHDHPEEAAELVASINDNAEALEGHIAELESVSTDQVLLDKVAAFDIQHEKITEAMLEAAPAVQAGTYNVDDTTISAIDAEALALSSAPTERAQARADEALQNLQRVLGVLIAATVGIVMVAAVAGWVLARRIVRPIVALTDRAVKAASDDLPSAVNDIGLMTGEVEAPDVPRFTSDTKDELVDLAGALNQMQDSSLELAVMQRRTELNNADTLVNLGRRNQSLLTRTLSYLGELERGERDEALLAKLYRLDHVTTRVRRNMESMLVLAGVEQTRTFSRPVAITDVVRASLSEIEDFTRVTIHHMEPAMVQGAVTADLAHLLAELIENGAHFSPASQKVLVTGRDALDEYVVSVIDEGMGMTPDELADANAKLSSVGRELRDSRVLGHHIVGRIAARHGITVRLVASAHVGVTAQVRLPKSLLVEGAAPSAKPTTTARRAPITEPVRTTPAPAAMASPAAPSPVAAETPAGQPTPQVATPTRQRVDVAATAERPTVPTQPVEARSTVRRVPGASLNGAPADSPRPVRRVRGANLGDLAEVHGDDDVAEANPEQARRQFAGLQSSVARARQQAAALSQIDDNPNGTL